MLPDKQEPFNSGEENATAASTGNASNPSPQDEETGPPGANRLLDKKAEKYLREAGNIEDVPDAEEQQEADDTIKKETGK